MGFIEKLINSRIRDCNRFLNKLGFRLAKIDRFQEAIEYEYSRKRGAFKFVQVGANDGVRFDGLYGFVTSRECSGIVIEPLTEYYEKLKQNYANFPSIKPIRVAIHAESKQVDIHYVPSKNSQNLPEWVEGVGSINPEHWKKFDISPDLVGIETVAATSLMKIIHEHSLEELSLLQVDTEGYDYEIIKMIDFDAIKPSVIKFEHAHLGKAHKRELSNLLQKHGYNVYKTHEDFIAVRKFG
jgi:FkbM family methyltransferase